MSEPFGARLRDCRERQQIPLRAIAEQTKISIALLDGLERGDVSHWPGGIFRRSFVRAYAQAIGLDADAIVREFLALYPDPEDDGVKALAAATAAHDSPVRRLRAVFGSTVRSLGGSSTSADRSRPATSVDGPDGTAVPPSASALNNASPAPGVLEWSAPSPAPPVQPIEADEIDAVRPTPAPVVVGQERTGPDLPAWQPDLGALAALCRELACVDAAGQLVPLLARAAGLLDAAGLIVWAWDPDRAALRPTLAHGYPPAVLAHVPAVERAADNVTAAAFRTAEPCGSAAGDCAHGALAVPLLTPGGCAGVLALELRRGREDDATVRAAATIVAAQLAAMIGAPAETVAERRRA